MKNVRKYLFRMGMMFSFACGFMGMKAEAALPQVTGIKQVEADPSTIKLEWTSVLGSGDYQVDLSMDGKDWGEVEKDSTGGQSTATIGGLSAGTSYYVRVRAFKEEDDWDTGETTREESVDWSEIVECVTTPSGDPEYIHKTDSTTTSISLEWGTVDGANAYLVKYEAREGSAGELSIVTTDTKATLKNLSKNMTYNVYIHPARQSTIGSFLACEGGGNIGEHGFGVTPTKITGVKITEYWEDSFNVECDLKASAVKYQAELWTAHQKKDKKLASSECDTTPQISGITTTHLARKELEKYAFFKVRMRGYSINTDGSKCYGAWSDWKYLCRQPEMNKIKASKSGMKLTWDTIKGADRYTIYASMKKKTGYKKVATTKKTTYTVKKFNKSKLKKGKTYYFYVVAEKKVGKKYYSGELPGANKRWSKKYKY